MARAGGGVLLAAALAACAPDPAPAPATLPAPPSIVLVTLDTLRRDHLGCYGYFRDTTPNLDALARQSLVFERALAPMASTLPSHLSMLTGLYPHQHGMSSNRRGASVPYVSELGRLSAAEVLRQCGYRTAAFVSAAPLSLRTGIQAGFDTYSFLERSPDGGSQPAAATNELVLAWLAQHAHEERPLFLWVHYFDPHEPNDPPAPYDGLFRTDERQREWILARGIDPVALERRYARSARARRHFFPPAHGERAEEPLAIGLEDVAELMNRYDGELRYLDEQLGVLFAALERHGLGDAVLAVVADHGQSLGEDAWLGHGTITNVNTLVPAILRLPRACGVPAGRVSALVSLVDLFPTILARFELPGSELLVGQLEGEDVLAPGFARDAVLTERTADELDDGETGPVFALLSERWKLVHRPAGRDELFDLAGPGEGVDVRAAHPDVAARLAAEAREILRRRPALLEKSEADASADPELLETLRDLGYAGDEGD